MSHRALFIQIVRALESLPASLRENAVNVRALEEHRFDLSYIGFLDEQIHLNPRGFDWTERLKRRRTALFPFCDETLLRGKVQVGESDFAVEIDLNTKTVVHWEQYEVEQVK